LQGILPTTNITSTSDGSDIEPAVALYCDVPVLLFLAKNCIVREDEDG